MYTYPEEFIIRPPFLPTDEEYGVLPGAFSPLCLRAGRTLKLSLEGSLTLVSQAPSVPARHRLALALAGERRHFLEKILKF